MSARQTAEHVHQLKLQAEERELAEARARARAETAKEEAAENRETAHEHQSEPQIPEEPSQEPLEAPPLAHVSTPLMNPSTKEADVDVILPLTRSAVLRPMLRGLERGTVRPKRVTLITNFSPTYVRAIIEGCGLSKLQVDLLRFDSTVHGHGSYDAGLRRNVAIFDEGPEAVCIFDDDQVPSLNMIEWGTRRLEEAPPSRPWVWGHHRFIDYEGRNLEELWAMPPECGIEREHPPNHCHGWASGYAGHVYTTRAAYRAVGGFDLAYSCGGCDDQNLARRVTGEDGLMVFEPPFAWHPTKWMPFDLVAPGNVCSFGKHDLVEVPIENHPPGRIRGSWSYQRCNKCPWVQRSEHDLEMNFVYWQQPLVPYEHSAMMLQRIVLVGGRAMEAVPEALEKGDSAEPADAPKPSEVCRDTGAQNCHFCDDIACGDNTSEKPAQVADAHADEADIEVVVPLTRSAVLGPMLMGFERQTVRPKKVTLVSNCDPKEIEKLVRASGISKLQVEQLQFETKEYAHGFWDQGLRRNIAAFAPGPSCVCLFDDDQIPTPDMIQAGMALLEKAPQDRPWIWGNYRYIDFSLYDLYDELPSMDPERGKNREAHSNQIQSWRSGYAGLIFVKREAFQKVGGFDLIYTRGGSEDQNLTRRVVGGDGQIVVYEPPFAWHPIARLPFDLREQGNICPDGEHTMAEFESESLRPPYKIRGSWSYAGCTKCPWVERSDKDRELDFIYWHAPLVPYDHTKVTVQRLVVVSDELEESVLGPALSPIMDTTVNAILEPSSEELQKWIEQAVVADTVEPGEGLSEEEAEAEEAREDGA